LDITSCLGQDDHVMILTDPCYMCASLVSPRSCQSEKLWCVAPATQASLLVYLIISTYKRRMDIIGRFTEYFQKHSRWRDFFRVSVPPWKVDVSPASDIHRGRLIGSHYPHSAWRLPLSPYNPADRAYVAFQTVDNHSHSCSGRLSFFGNWKDPSGLAIQLVDSSVEVFTFRVLRGVCKGTSIFKKTGAFIMEH